MCPVSLLLAEIVSRVFRTESDNPSPLDVGSVEVEEGLRLSFYLFILFIFLFPVVFSMSPGCQG